MKLDVGFAGAALRVALGAMVVGVVGGAFGGGTFAQAALVLGVSLFLVKALAAVGRRLTPATPEVRAIWDWRRELARCHDSYQWRKLLWVGCGIVVAGAVTSHARWAWTLGPACIGAGALAEVVWRRKGLVPPVPAASARSLPPGTGQG